MLAIFFWMFTLLTSLARYRFSFRLLTNPWILLSKFISNSLVDILSTPEAALLFRYFQESRRFSSFKSRYRSRNRYFFLFSFAFFAIPCREVCICSYSPTCPANVSFVDYVFCQLLPQKNKYYELIRIPISHQSPSFSIG
jgi:hypothetical protein